MAFPFDFDAYASAPNKTQHFKSLQVCCHIGLQSHAAAALRIDLCKYPVCTVLHSKDQMKQGPMRTQRTSKIA